MEESDASDLDVAYGSVGVEDLQGNAIDLDDLEEEAELVAVQFWNPGCSNSTAWTGKACLRVLVKNADGEVVSANKREILLRHVVDKVTTRGWEMIGPVDCGVHEDGVEGLETELQEIVNCLNDPKPDINVHRTKKATSSSTRVPW